MAKTKVELQNYQGESLSPITIASNVLYEDGRNAQEVFEEYSNETFTPTIENSSSMFKVGQGDSVDYSDNVVNGAYESMVLKGKSMVNCIQEPSSQDVILPYEFEDGQYVTINDTKESGALGVELKGQTLVNLISDITQIKSTATVELIEYSLSPMSFVAKYGNTVSNTGNNRIVIHTPFKERLKLNEDYTIVYDYELLENPDNVDCQIAIAVDMWGQMAESPVIQTKGSKGRVVHRRNRASNNISTTFNFINNQGTNAKWKISNLMLLEGDWTNKEIPPYFEGMTSCKMPILHTVGKNLFDGAVTKSSIDVTTGEIFPNENSVWFATDYIDVKDIKSLCFQTGYMSNLNVVYMCFDSNKKFIGYKGFYNSLTSVINPLENTHYIRLRLHSTIDLSTTQIEQGTQATSYEPYKSSILSLPEDVVLRNIGSVKDTLNLNTGDYIQRIGEVVLDGSEDELWSLHQISSYTTHTRFEFSLRSNNKPLGIVHTELKCDRFTWINGDVETEHIKIDGGNTRSIFIYIQNSKLATQDVNGLRVWLSQNPTIIQYQLETPIVTKINLPSTLKSWNTTTHIYSEIPENTLYPTLSHSNPTYPVILKPSTKYSIVANSYSNNHTNSTINFNLGGATASTTVGNRVTTITTPSTLSNELLTMSGRGNKLNNVMVIEGDVVGDEPYFEGICDSKSPILSNVGENLFTTNNMRTGNIAGNSSHIEGDDISGNWQVTDYIPVKPLIEYYHSTSLYKFEKASFYDINKKIIYGTGVNNFKTRVISTPHQCAYVRYVVMKDSSTNNSLSLEELVSNNDIVVAQGSLNIAYEPYKSNILSFNQKDGKTIVLRSLPNGVCDTLNLTTGEYIQRIGEVVLDGSSDENWNNNSNGENVETLTQFNIGASIYKGALPKTAKDESVVKNAFIQNMFAVQKSTVWVYQKGEACAIYMENPTHGSQAIQAKVLRSRLSSQDVAGWRALLQATPWILQYELATPIVSTIDVQGFPYAYTNGHVQLSSGSIEQSLTPKVEYSVATNRNGQIRSNQKMVERHQKQLDQLQAIILANMVNTQYQQTLTTLNYDLLKKEVGE